MAIPVLEVVAVALLATAAAEDSAPVPARVLDLAFLDDHRLAVLLEGGVSLYQRQGGAALRLIDHRALDPSLVVRAPAGIIVADGSSFWVSTNTAEGAVLFTSDGGRLHETERAAALPFRGSPQGARFREGTNLVEVTVPGLGSGPHLRAGASGESVWAIAPDGRLGTAAGWSTTRVGSAAALLWPGTWVASSAELSGAGDSLAVVTSDAPPRVVASFPAPASVSAIAARAGGDQVLVAAAVSEGGRHRLILIEVTPDRP